MSLGGCTCHLQGNALAGHREGCPKFRPHVRFDQEWIDEWRARGEGTFFGLNRDAPTFVGGQLHSPPRTFRDRWSDVLACLRYLPAAWKYGWPP